LFSLGANKISDIFKNRFVVDEAKITSLVFTRLWKKTVKVGVVNGQSHPDYAFCNLSSDK